MRLLPFAILLLAPCTFSCDDHSTGSAPPTTMPNAAAPSGMNQYPYLAADGGPHMLLPVDVAAAWSGVTSPASVLNPKSDYGRACAATTPAGIAAIPVGSGSALVLSDPPMTAWGKSADGLVEIYKLNSWKGMNLDALVVRATAAFPTSALTDTGIKLHLESPDAFLLFAGDTPTSSAYGVYRVPLAAGTYHVLSGSYVGPGESVIIYRLQRTGP